MGLNLEVFSNLVQRVLRQAFLKLAHPRQGKEKASQGKGLSRVRGGQNYRKECRDDRGVHKRRRRGWHPTKEKGRRR